MKIFISKFLTVVTVAISFSAFSAQAADAVSYRNVNGVKWVDIGNFTAFLVKPIPRIDNPALVEPQGVHYSFMNVNTLQSDRVVANRLQVMGRKSANSGASAEPLDVATQAEVESLKNTILSMQKQIALLEEKTAAFRTAAKENIVPQVQQHNPVTTGVAPVVKTTPVKNIHILDTRTFAKNVTPEMKERLLEKYNNR